MRSCVSATLYGIFSKSLTSTNYNYLIINALKNNHLPFSTKKAKNTEGSHHVRNLTIEKIKSPFDNLNLKKIIRFVLVLVLFLTFLQNNTKSTTKLSHINELAVIAQTTPTIEIIFKFKT
jgi:hypothetical protein